jgi:hypothetical protein
MVYLLVSMSMLTRLLQHMPNCSPVGFSGYHIDWLFVKGSLFTRKNCFLRHTWPSSSGTSEFGVERMSTPGPGMR